jgi:hypothetical protein
MKILRKMNGESFLWFLAAIIAAGLALFVMHGCIPIFQH